MYNWERINGEGREASVEYKARMSWIIILKRRRAADGGKLAKFPFEYWRTNIET